MDITVVTAMVAIAVFFIIYGIFGAIVLWSTVKEFIESETESY